MNLEIFIFPSHLITEMRYYKLRFLFLYLKGNKRKYNL